MDQNRKLAYLILRDVNSDEAYSNLAINRRLRTENCSNPGFVRDIVYTVLRNRTLIDFQIQRFLKSPKLKPAELCILRMGFCQLGFMDSVKAHAAVDETVALAKLFIPGKQGFINAVLRNFEREGCEIRYPDKKDILKYLSVRYSCAEDIVELWISQYGEEKAEEMLGASLSPAALSIRINPLKALPEDVVRGLRARDYSLEGSPLVKNGRCFRVQGKSLLDTPEYKLGMFSVQGEASQLAIELLNPKPGETMIDLCAAPGGKSCAAAEKMKNRGKILAFDVYDTRLGLIEKQAERLGISIIKSAEGDGARLNRALLEGADCVLADVPCSGLGVLSKKPEIKLRGLGDELKELTKLQAEILENAAAYVKPGGRLVYSTCTVNKLENVDITASFLKNNDKFAEEKSIQLFPGENCPDGFYICLMKKVKQ